MIRKRNIFRQPCSIHWNKKTCKIYDGHKVMQLSYAKDLQTSFGDKSVKSVRGRTDSVWTILYIQCMPSTIRSVCDVMDSLTLNRSLNSLSLNRRLRRKTLEKEWILRQEWKCSLRGRKCGLLELSRCLFMHPSLYSSAGRRRQDLDVDHICGHCAWYTVAVWAYH